MSSQTSGEQHSPSQFQLFYLIKGDERPFSVRIEGDWSVADLTRLIWKDSIHQPSNILAKDLKLFQVDMPLGNLKDNNFSQLTEDSFGPRLKEPVSTWKPISVFWPTGPTAYTLHMFVTTNSISPSSSADSDLLAIPDKLQAFYNDSWGKDWPTRKGIISVADGTSSDDMMDIDVTSNDDNNIKRTEPASHTWEYTCLVGISALTDAFKLSTAVRDVVVVRDEYAKLRKELEADEGSFVLTGQPGIGKTNFLIYLLLLRLRKKLPTAIQFHPKRYILFDENGVHVCHHSKSQLPNSCWALSDSNNNVIQPCQAFQESGSRIIQTTSPRPDRWKGWFKYARSCRVVIVDPPNRLEIAAIAKELTGRKASDVVKLVEKWGPCTRTVVKLLETSTYIKAHRRQVRSAAEQIAEQPPVVSSSSLQEVDSKRSPLVFIYPVRDSNSTPSDDFRRDIPTTKLISIYNASCSLSLHQAALKLFNVLSMHPLTRSVAGWQHENRMHATMISHVDPLELVGRHRKTREMQPTSHFLASTLHELQQGRRYKAFYWRPIIHNFPGIDGVLVDASNVFVLQATIANEHGSPTEGIRSVWKHLGPNSKYQRAWHFVTVVDRQNLAKRFTKYFRKELKKECLGKVARIRVWGCVLPQQ